MSLTYIYSRRSIKSRLAFWTSVILISVGFYLTVLQVVRFRNRSSEALDKVSETSSETDPIRIKYKELNFSKARFDSRRILRIYDWIWKGDNWDHLMDTLDVCLATQGSMDRINWIPEVVQYWRGPVSLAVFITTPEEWTGLNILVDYFRRCYPLFRDFVSIHIAVPSKVEKLNFSFSEPDSDVLKIFWNHGDSCADPEKFVDLVLKKFKPGEEANELMTAYPQNHMRNIARKTCGTNWVYSTDIDIIPRSNSATRLQEFYETDAAQTCGRCAFVIPTFELQDSQPYPESKQELVDNWINQQARPFHFDVYADAHNATDYTVWSETNLDEEPVKVSHDAIKTRMAHYEPFYISSDTIPEFDERFMGYGFTRSSQTQEALAEGWEFKVLSPIFGIHRGLQNLNTLINPGNQKVIRRRQTFWNGRLFKRFLREMDLRRKLRAQEEDESLHMTTPDFSVW